MDQIWYTFGLNYPDGINPPTLGVPEQIQGRFTSPYPLLPWGRGAARTAKILKRSGKNDPNLCTFGINRLNSERFCGAETPTNSRTIVHHLKKLGPNIRKELEASSYKYIGPQPFLAIQKIYIGYQLWGPIGI